MAKRLRRKQTHLFTIEALSTLWLDEETAGVHEAQEVLLLCHGRLIVLRCYLRNKTPGKLLQHPTTTTLWTAALHMDKHNNTSIHPSASWAKVTLCTVIHCRFQISSVFQILLLFLHFVPSPALFLDSQRDCAPAVMMAPVCGVLRKPVKGEIAALATCILGLGVGVGGPHQRFLWLCRIVSLPSTMSAAGPPCVWWGNFSWADIPRASFCAKWKSAPIASCLITAMDWNVNAAGDKMVDGGH